MSAVREKIRIDLGDRSYDILIGETLASLGQAVAERLHPSRLLLVADRQVGELYAVPALESLRAAGLTVEEPVLFPPGEGSKSFAELQRLYDRLFDMRADRKSALVALGGGVTGDLAGFLAATFMRGIDFVQVPTTILAQVDSAIGGKVAVNHPKGKNMIGAFHQPRLVYTALETLSTLPPEEFASGMAEVVKHGVIRDAAYFVLLEERLDEIRALDPAALAAMLAGSCRIKGAVVAEDEREEGLRAILNFGHTFGHALEALTGFARYRHGEAVAIGMVAAARLGERLLGFPAEERLRMTRLLAALELPAAIPEDLATGAILDSMFGDKKTEYGTLRLVLPRRLGAVEILPVNDLDSVRAAIDAARET